MFISPGLPQGGFMVTFLHWVLRLYLFLELQIFFSFWFFLFSWGIAALQCWASFSVVQWRESAVGKHISPLSWTSIPTTPSNPPIKGIPEHQAKLPVPDSRIPLAICFIHDSVHMSIPISQFIPIPSPAHVHTVSTSVSLSLPCKQVHLYQFSRFHIPILIDNICFFLSDYFTLYNRYSGPSTSLQVTQYCSFYGWGIFHCIYVPHLLYSFIYWWTFRLLPCPGCK